MRIKNIGKCLIVFSGGSLPAGKIADFRGEAEKIGAALLKAYPDRLMDLDNVEEQEVISVEVHEEPKAEETVESKPVANKKSKKSNKK